MNPIGKDWEKTRSVLSTVYGNRKEVSLGPQWQNQVMDAIRALPREAAMEKPVIMLEQMVWRFAPVACLLIMAMTIVLFSQDFSPQYGLVEAMMDDSINNILTQAINMQ